MHEIILLIFILIIFLSFISPEYMFTYVTTRQGLNFVKNYINSYINDEYILATKIECLLLSLFVRLFKFK